MIHIEGMGLLGAVLARLLDASGVAWTWSDADDPHCAWPASTGLIFPDPDPGAAGDLLTWGRWAAKGLFSADELAPATYVYAQKTPPHRATYPTRDLGDGLTLAESPAWVADPRRLVTRVRADAAAQRRPGPDPGDRIARMHGRIWRHNWGWSAPVRLDTAALGPLPATPALIGRRVRVSVDAYPIPSRPGWWRAGTAMRNQRTPHQLDAHAHLERWLLDYKARFPTVPVIETGHPAQGWRPRPHPDDPPGVTTDPDGAVRVPALWHSGVRRAPSTVAAVLRALGQP